MEMLEWKETEPGRYERSLDAMESVFAFLTSRGALIGRDPFAITAAVKINSRTHGDLVTTVRQAWTTLRYENPSLASMTEGNKRVYQVANDAELDKWLKETFIVNESSINAKHLFNELRPVKRATLYLLLQSKELVFRCSHDLFDGIGVIHFFDSLLQVLGSERVISGDEAKNLFPTLKIAANIPDATQGQVDKVKTHMNKWFNSSPIIKLEAINTDQLPGATKTQHITLSENETISVITAAKKLGLTPTHVVHAAIILAVRSLGHYEEDSNYVSSGHFNLRSQCENTVNNCYTLWPLIVTPADFINTTKQLKEFYVGFLKDQDSLPMIEAFALEFKASLAAHLQTSRALLSSLGIINLQKTYGQIGIENFWLAVDTVSDATAIFLWTLQGRMTIEICYNEVFHQDISIEKYLQTIKDILFKELVN